MNCKPGDLAIVVGARYNSLLIGRIVTVIRLVPIGSVHWSFDGPQVAENDEVWLVCCGDKDWIHADSRLRPIRDNPGEDEMLRIVGKPSELAA